MHKESFGIVYSNKKYVYFSIAIFAGLFFALSLLSEFIFLSPSFVFYVPVSGIANFVLVVAISALSGIVASFSIYRIRMNKGLRSSAGFVGSMVGAGAGACSCGPLGFSAISIFGTVGGTATAFLANYETPLRIVSIAILCYTYYAAARDITAKCKIVK